MKKKRKVHSDNSHNSNLIYSLAYQLKFKDYAQLPKKKQREKKEGRRKYNTIIHITTLEQTQQSCFQSFVLIIVILPVPLV